MALASGTETDLLLPLFGAMRENPRFATFLERLRRRTEARYVALLVRQGESQDAATQTYFAGEDLHRRAQDAGIPDLFALDRAHYDSLRPGRVYAISELIDHDPLARSQRRQQMAALGLADERIVRVLAERDFNVWLVLARGAPCRAADSALLSSLAPYIAEALRTIRALDHEARQAAISLTGLARAGNGWMAFERDARLAAIGPQAAQWWEAQGHPPPRPGERLLGLPRAAERTLLAAAEAMTDDPALPPRPMLLSEEPRVEALLLPLESHGANERPLTMALFTLPRTASPEARERLQTIHALPRREAELALRLAEGLTIAEAAEAMGLTVETARNYSKRIYAKLGVSGKAQLVRLVLQGTAGMN
ncbi:helix-turn-helix transcriptional regulator [Novosphingobium sp. 1949]|uniref:Helix-turn-helix transcriptional regulator n=1 Tax=Novosphingobium organovorum TaxID=2930092 RepID=A0ABT0B997_9SPHN|nr:helix-turn-helix transcriptional regulator [Novosphingobium organovorum]MCJ2181641.1 helix-turn-helix transcriptional regulator [Novosphingobium organovorum]